MKITFLVTESGTRSLNVDLPDATSHIAGRSAYADEARALLAFAALDDVPESFVDGDGDEWHKVGERVFLEDGDRYTYEFRA